MNTTRQPNLLGRALGALLLLLAGGCFQIETVVNLHEDGSATITERFQLSRRLMEFEKRGGGPALARGLTREAALERMKLMGKGIALVSHEQRDGEAGAKEAVSVFKIPDVTEFQYVSPFLGTAGYPGHCMMKCEVAAGGGPPGYMYVMFRPFVNDAAKAKVEAPKTAEKNPPKGPSPAELQALRHLQPVVRDLLEGIHVKFTIRSYAPVHYAWGVPGVRNGAANTHDFYLIDFSDKDLDAYGGSFLENEEILLELEQMQLEGPNIRQHLYGMIDNLTLPLFYSRGAPIMAFRPSRHYFDRFYAGKTLDFGPRDGGKRPAKFEEVGWPRPPNAKP
jgi:hypothetical protein